MRRREKEEGIEGEGVSQKNRREEETARRKREKDKMRKREQCVGHHLIFMTWNIEDDGGDDVWAGGGGWRWRMGVEDGDGENEEWMMRKKKKRRRRITRVLVVRVHHPK